MPHQDEPVDAVVPTGEIGVSDESVAVAETEGEDAGALETAVRDAVTMSVAGEKVTVHDSLVGAAAAGEMEAHDTLIVVGAVGSLGGNARVLVGVPAALAFGAALGLVIVLVGRLFGREDVEEEE